MSGPEPGFFLVTRGEFFAALYADPRDIMPRSEPSRTVWEDQRTRAVWGMTTPGYRLEGERTYQLRGPQNGR